MALDMEMDMLDHQGTTTLILIRHGQTAWNDEGRIQGQQDVELDEAGILQAQSLAPAVLELEPEYVYASDLVRARRTAELATVHLGLPIHIDPRLRERCFGEYETLTRREIREKFDPHFFSDERGEPDQFIEGAEMIEDFQTRCVSALSDIAEGHPGRRIALFTHGGVIRSWVCHWLGIPMTAPRRFKVSNTSIHIFESHPILTWVAGCLGDTRHIKTHT